MEELETSSTWPSALERGHSNFHFPNRALRLNLKRPENKENPPELKKQINKRVAESKT